MLLNEEKRMSLTAKQVVKNKFWVVEEDGKKVATIQANETGASFVVDGQREQFSNIKTLGAKYNIIFDKTRHNKVKKDEYDVHGFHSVHKPFNVLWDVKHKLPIFTKSDKSKSFYCAGWYVVRFDSAWFPAQCPKLITLNRYDYYGPFKTKEEMKDRLKELNDGL